MFKNLAPWTQSQHNKSQQRWCLLDQSGVNLKHWFFEHLPLVERLNVVFWLVCVFRVVFNWVSYNQNQSCHSNQSQSWLRKVRENVCEQVTIGFGPASDWMKKWHEFFKPIVRCVDAKPITFWYSMKTTLDNKGVTLGLVLHHTVNFFANLPLLWRS